MPDLLKDADNGLTSANSALYQELSGQLRYFNETINRVTKVLKTQAKSNETAVRLMQIKGVKVKISIAIIAHAGNGHGYITTPSTDRAELAISQTNRINTQGVNQPENAAAKMK